MMTNLKVITDFFSPNEYSYIYFIMNAIEGISIAWLI